MAKAQDIPISPWEPYASAGARIVRVRTDELFEAASGVLDTSDIERVHDMRVASRRLRAVLEVFAACFPRAEFREVLRDVKAVADALGERRDPDVHIDAMERLLASAAPAEQPGLQAMIDHLRGRQAHGNGVLEEALARVETTALRERLHSLASRAEEPSR